MEVLREGALAATLVRLAWPSFNPCFDGSVERGRRERPAGRKGERSFNPCFDGSVERGHPSRARFLGFAPVSILVLMEVLREEPRSRRCRAPIHGVSILVLMEVLREGTQPARERVFSSGFNPCFDGSVERGTERTRPTRFHAQWFQSLF